MTKRTWPTYAQLKSRDGRLAGTAWGLFGEHDALGSLNHLDPELVRTAAGEVVTGESYGLNLPLDAFDPPLIAHRGVPKHEIFGLNDFHRDDRLDNLYPQASTQIDGLRHFGHPDHGFWGGVSPDELDSSRELLGIQHLAQRGVVGRGVLIDIAGSRERHGRGLDHTSNEQIGVDELDEVLDESGVQLRPGDIVMVNFGWLSHFLSQPPQDRPATVRSPGLAQTEESAAWIWDHRIALIASDNIALEAWPVANSALTCRAETDGRMERSSHSGTLHRILIPLLGTVIGELWWLQELTTAMREAGRYTCMVVAQPLHVTGGVGTLANARAIL